MKLKKVIKEIYDGLSGDTLIDLHYLKECAEKYKDHEDEKEILRVLSDLFLEIVAKEEGIKDFRSINLEVRLEEVYDCMEQKDLNKALFICEEIIEEYEKEPLEDNDTTVFRCFREPIEEILWLCIDQEKRMVENPKEDYQVLYKVYGDLLFELENYEEAKQAYTKALYLNPMDFALRFNYIKCFNYMDDNDRFLELTDDSFKYAYTNQQYSYLYLNIGFYYWNIQYYEIAVACLYLSLSFDESNEEASMILNKINEETNKKWNAPEPEKVLSLFEEYEIPSAPNSDVISILYSYILKFKDINDDMAYYLCEYVYALTYADEVKKIMDELNEKDHVDMNQVTEEEWKNGSMILSLSKRYKRNPNEETLYDLIYALSKIEVIVPSYYEDLGYEEGLRPDLLRSTDGRLFYPIFTSIDEMPEGYAQKYSKVHVHFVNCLESAKRFENVEGIVVNPFTTSVELSFEEAEMIQEMNHKNFN